MVEVTQSARDAAAALVEWHNTAASEWHIEGGADLRFFAADMPKGIKRGIWDEHPFVQAFAAAEHRGHIAGMREAAGIAYRICAESRHVTLGRFAKAAIRQRATAIETGAEK